MFLSQNDVEDRLPPGTSQRNHGPISYKSGDSLNNLDYRQRNDIVDRALPQRFACLVHYLGRPSRQSRSALVGEGIDAPLDTLEPAIDIVEEEAWRSIDARRQVASPTRALRHGRRAEERALREGRQEGRTRSAAGHGVAARSPVLRHQPGLALAVVARCGCGRADEELDLAPFCDAQHAEAEPPAKVAESCIAFAPLAPLRDTGREPHLVGDAGTVDRLQHELEVEAELQLCDHHHGTVRAILQSEDVATADLALDAEAEPLEEALDRE